MLDNSPSSDLVPTTLTTATTTAATAATATAKATAESEELEALFELNREADCGEATAAKTTAAETTETPATAATTPCTVYFFQIGHRQFHSINGSCQLCLLNGIL